MTLRAVGLKPALRESETLAVKAEAAKTLKLPSTVLGLDRSADASHLYAACMDGGIYDVNVETGDAQLLTRHESYASGVCLLPQTSQLVSAGYDGVLQWHDLAANQTIRKIPAHQFWSWQSALSPDGKYFASVTGQYLAGGPKYEPAAETEPSVKVFDSQTGKPVAEFSHVPSVQAVAFSPDNQYVAAGNLMGETRVWELSSGKQLAAFTTSSFTSWGIIKVHCYQGGIYSLLFAPDSQSILACGMGQMRDPNTGNGRQTWQRFAWRQGGSPKTAEIHPEDTGGGHPESLAFHPSGKYFVMAGRLAQGKWNTGFFDEATGALIHSLDTKGRLTKALFNEDGSKLFLAGGIGQPKAKDGKYPDFGRIYVYNLA
jgi:WD40 repeat protein